MNVLSQADAARLLRWAMLWGNEHSEDGQEVRRLVFAMKEMLAAEDLLVLARLAERGGHQWLTDALLTQAGMKEEGNHEG